MSPILGGIAGVSTRGFGQFVNLYFSSFDSIATVTVGAGGTNSVTFTSIPQTYAHLQIRAIGRSTRASITDSVAATFNGTNTNYGTTGHALWGNGSSAFSQSDWIGGSSNSAYFGEVAGNNASSNVFGLFVTEVLDYSNTNKNKVIRLLGGADNNGNGTVNIGSSFWQNTSAITSITLTVTGNWQQYSQVGLYGVKVA